MAERLLQAGLSERYPAQFSVESAGTAALVGNPIDLRVAGFIRDLGGSADNFSARQLSPSILHNQDLVLTMSREHRSRVVELSPVMLRKTFTLREFARLLPSLQLDESLHGGDRWRAALPKALRARSARLDTPENDDIVDPYRRDKQIYFRMAAELAPTISTLVG
jgi:protein-tyrosine phosphatase